MSIDVPTEYGGSGQSFFSSVLVIEEFSKVDPSVGLFVDLQNTLLNRLFLNFGTEEQKHDYLPRMAKNLVLFFYSPNKYNEDCDMDFFFFFRLGVFVYQNQVLVVMHLL